MKTILLCFDDDTFTPDELARVHAQADGYEVLLTKDRAAIEARLDDVEIAAGAFPRDLLGRASNLRWWQQWGAGADWLLDAPEVQAMDFTLTNTSGIHAIQISEHIFAFLLAFFKVPEALVSQLQGLGLGFIGTGLMVAVAFLLIGMFIDAIPAIIILGTVLWPVAEAAGYHPIHFAIIGVVALAFGLVTPPYGLCLLISCSLGNIRVVDVLKDLVIMLTPMLFVLLLIVLLPDLILWLPRLLMPDFF